MRTQYKICILMIDINNWTILNSNLSSFYFSKYKYYFFKYKKYYFVKEKYILSHSEWFISRYLILRFSVEYFINIEY